MAFDGVPHQVPEPREARGVVYSESPHAPGLKLFRCGAYRCTLSMKACADRWTRAQDAKGEEAWRLAACRACSIGAAHAGHGFVHYSPHYGSAICARCGRGGMRIIGGRVCVSCYNRSREIKAGKNARGNKPVELLQKPLQPVEMLVETLVDVNGKVDVQARRLRDRESSSLTETMVQFLRTHTGEVAFGFAGAGIQRQQCRADTVGTEASDAQDEPEAVDCSDRGEPAPLSSAGPDVGPRHRQVWRYRARLFASTALTAAATKKEPARWGLAGWRRHEAAR